MRNLPLPFHRLLLLLAASGRLESPQSPVSPRLARNKSCSWELRRAFRSGRYSVRVAALLMIFHSPPTFFRRKRSMYRASLVVERISAFAVAMSFVRSIERIPKAQIEVARGLG